MLVNTPKKGDLIYKAFGLKIETYIVVDTRNDIDSSILMLNLNAEKGSDTHKLTELFKDGKTDTKEYKDLMFQYNNLYTGFYGKYGIRLHSQYFYKLKEVREQIKLNKVAEINKLKQKNIELQDNIQKNLDEIKKLAKTI